MPRAARKISSTDTYHIIMRGVNRQPVFLDQEDYDQYLTGLFKFRRQYEFQLYAWCLMPNHVHLLLKTEKYSTGTIFKSHGSAFVYWYNKKYDRVGPLYDGRYKSEPVESRNYLLTVFRYIHMNPVKAGICQTPEMYPYSSYSYYFNNFDQKRILGMMTRDEFIRFHMEPNDDICLDI